MIATMIHLTIQIAHYIGLRLLCTKIAYYLYMLFGIAPILCMPIIAMPDFMPLHNQLCYTIN